MLKQILICCILSMMGLQIWAQNPLPAFDRDPGNHPAKAGHFDNSHHSNDTLSLPFYEDWESGSFNTQSWQTDCSNWKINTIIGIPGNCAEFKWDPVLTDYSCGLISASINASGLIDGDIFLNFDLEVDDRFDTVSSEKLYIKVYSDQSWIVIDSIIAMGDVDWYNIEYDITEWAKGKVFQVGFFAEGESSINIDSWFVDNVNINVICAGPAEFQAFPTGFWGDDAFVELHWSMEPPTETYWISYNDGTFENAFASEEGGAGLAQMFSPNEYPCTIKKIRYFNSSYAQYQQECEIWILAGDGETVLDGPYYVENGPADGWVTIEIEDVVIEGGAFMMATFNVNPEGPYIGVDDSYYDGSLYFGSIGNFTEFGEYGYYYVGMHEVLVEVEQEGMYSLNTENVYKRDLTGFNIWKDNILIQENWPDTVFYDTVNNGWITYCYQLQTVYDQCISDKSEYECVGLMSLFDNETSPLIIIQPNPASDRIIISCSDLLNIKKVDFFNTKGQRVSSTLLNSENLEFEISALTAGVYFINFHTNHGTTTKKLIKY